MVRITKVSRETQEYYILAYSIRKGRKVIKKEKYLGKKLPDNIMELKEEFSHEIYKEMYVTDLEYIHKQYRKKREQMSSIEKEDENFGITYTYDSNRIEGSTLTQNETRVLILHEQSPKRPLKDILESKAHYELVRDIKLYKGNLNINIVLEWHYRFFKDSQSGIAGKLRERTVKISGSKLRIPTPVELQPLLEEFFQWYKEKKKLIHPVELAMIVHYKFVSIHPFMDGNGRISRLLMNYVLNKYGYPMYNIRNQERHSYYKVLAKADKKKDLYAFAYNLTKKYINLQKKANKIENIEGKNIEIF